MTRRESGKGKNRQQHDCEVFEKEIPREVGYAYFEDGREVTTPGLTAPYPRIILEVKAQPDLANFGSHEKAVFILRLGDDYPALPPSVWYRRTTRPFEPHPFDAVVITGHTLSDPDSERDGELPVVHRLLSQDKDSEWSRAYDLVIVFHALRELLRRPDCWWHGLVHRSPLSLSVASPRLHQHTPRRVHFSVGHHEAQGNRGTMEDALSIVLNNGGGAGAKEGWSVFSIFDGHGGQECALFAASRVAEAVLQGFSDALDCVDGTLDYLPKAYAKVLNSALKNVDEDFMKQIKAESDTRGGEDINCSGCTALVLAADSKGSVFVASLGDCRAVLCRGGKALLLSASEHKATRKDEMARVLSCGGFVLGGRVMGQLAVTRALGDVLYKGYLPNMVRLISTDAEVMQHDVSPPDGDEFIVMACDGLWDVMSNQEVVDFVVMRLKQSPSKKGEPEEGVLSEVSRQLVEEAIEARGSMDNVSVVLIRLSSTAASNGTRSFTFSTSDAARATAAGTVVSTPSAFVPEDLAKVDASEAGEPANGFVVRGGAGVESEAPSVQREVSAEDSAVSDVDALLKELSSLDALNGARGGADTERGGASAMMCEGTVGGSLKAAGGKAGLGKAASGDIGGDTDLMEYLMNDSNFEGVR